MFLNQQESFVLNEPTNFSLKLSKTLLSFVTTWSAELVVGSSGMVKEWYQTPSYWYLHQVYIHLINYNKGRHLSTTGTSTRCTSISSTTTRDVNYQLLVPPPGVHPSHQLQQGKSSINHWYLHQVYIHLINYNKGHQLSTTGTSSRCTSI